MSKQREPTTSGVDAGSYQMQLDECLRFLDHMLPSILTSIQSFVLKQVSQESPQRLDMRQISYGPLEITIIAKWNSSQER
jgi:hypothetical protein